MNTSFNILLAAGLAAPLFAQNQFELQAQTKAVQAQVDALQHEPGNRGLIDADRMAQLKDQLTLLQGNVGAVTDRGKTYILRDGKTYITGDGAYNAGTSALDQHRYEAAVEQFDRVIAAKSPRAEGALYWKAYALNRIGRRDEGLAAIAALRRDYPASRWLNDAQLLEGELKQGSGQPVSPAQESNEDLKLMAINSLMNADPERAMPLLEGILKGSGSPRLKDRALFVITQSRSPRAQQVLMDYAKGAGNPDLQIQAIRYIGMSGTSESFTQLSTVYGGSADAEVKRAIIRSLTASNAKGTLFNIAKAEKDESLRSDAIRQLGTLRAVNELMQLMSANESNGNVKVEIVRALMMSGATDKIAELSRDEKDPRVRKELINGLMARGDAKALVDMARKETDLSVKKDIVSRLAGMRNNKDATDYMMELLK